MPNICNNHITIDNNKIPRSLLLKTEEYGDDMPNKVLFNIEALYPDDTSEKNLERFIENTSQKRDLEVNINEYNDNVIMLQCDSARAPPIKLCKQIAKQFKTSVCCEYEEPWCAFEWTYDAVYNPKTDEIDEIDDAREYVPYCYKCGNKKENTIYDEVEHDHICKDCLPNVKPTLIKKVEKIIFNHNDIPYEVFCSYYPETHTHEYEIPEEIKRATNYIKEKIEIEELPF